MRLIVQVCSLVSKKSLFTEVIFHAFGTFVKEKNVRRHCHLLLQALVLPQKRLNYGSEKARPLYFAWRLRAFIVYDRLSTVAKEFEMWEWAFINFIYLPQRLCAQGGRGSS